MKVKFKNCDGEFEDVTAKKIETYTDGTGEVEINNSKLGRVSGGIKLDKILMWIAIILIALSGFSIKINSFEFEWLGVLGTVIRIFK